jgi:hypothetical protein
MFHPGLDEILQSLASEIEGGGSTGPPWRRDLIQAPISWHFYSRRLMTV